MRLHRVAHALRNWPRFDIMKNGTLYIRRYYVAPWHATTPDDPLSVKIHQIHTTDLDPHCHDHPWAFLSIVLRGCYWETNTDGRERHVRWWNLKLVRRGRGLFGWRSEGVPDNHRITRLCRVPTTTLVLNGRRRRVWGYYTEDGWVPWDGYVAYLRDHGYGERQNSYSTESNRDLERRLRDDVVRVDQDRGSPSR